MRNILTAALAAICVLLSATAAESAKPEVKTGFTVVKAARVVDPKAGKVLTDQAIIINGDRVQSIVAAADYAKALPADAKVTVVDLGAATVLPGLIDCHTHVTGQPENFYEDIFRKSPIDEATTSHIYAKRTLDAGFTTIRNV